MIEQSYKDRNLGKLVEWRSNPLLFIRDVFGLGVARDKASFIKGEELTHQQGELFEVIRRGIRNEGKRRIAIKSGHGTGKSASMSLLIFWFLFCFKNAQIACTAPSADQMFSVLWKELALWHSRMPDELKGVFVLGSDKLAIKGSEGYWFARARTARKESPEALQGIHGENVLIIVDEASGVPEEIFRVAEGILTNENILMVMIGNPTRLEGAFRECFTDDKENWELLTFDSEDSPIVEDGYIRRFEGKYGRESDEFRVRVKGEFPKDDMVDRRGYCPIFLADDLRIRDIMGRFIQPIFMGVDPSGEGSDETVWVIRDNMKAMVVGRERVSSGKSIAERTITLMDAWGVLAGNVYLDNFGIGANISQEMMLSNRYINGVNVGCDADDKDKFLNKRAEVAFRVKEFLSKGGYLSKENERDWFELFCMKFKANIRGKIKVISKDELRADGVRSPNVYDALSLTFFNLYGDVPFDKNKERVKEVFDPHDLF